MQNWILTLRLSEFESKSFDIYTDISQELFLSSVLYLFYNVNLLNIDNKSNLHTMTASWIDNVNYIMSEVSAEINCWILQALHAEVEIWAHWYTLIFVSTKYELIHFTNKSNCHNIFIVLILKIHNILSFSTYYVLRIILNLQLKFKIHVWHIETKATISLNELTVIADFMWKFELRDLWKLYISMILLQITYCCSVWYVMNRAHRTVL